MPFKLDNRYQLLNFWFLRKFFYCSKRYSFIPSCMHWNFFIFMPYYCNWRKDWSYIMEKDVWNDWCL